MKRTALCIYGLGIADIHASRESSFFHSAKPIHRSNDDPHAALHEQCAEICPERGGVERDDTNCGW